MSSLIVLLPPLDAFDAASWRGVPMPYARFDRQGRLELTGIAEAEAWPAAGLAVLVLAARDTLLVEAVLPPVTGMKLRRILPNVVEEHLIDDPQHCHVAVGPEPAADGARQLAVVDRERFGALLDAVAAAGFRRVRAVPLIHCMPSSETAEPPRVAPGEQGPAGEHEGERREPGLSDAGPVAMASAAASTTAEAASPTRGAAAGREVPVLATADVLIVSRALHAGDDRDSGGTGWLDVAVKQGGTGFGFETHASALDGSIASLASRQPVTVHALALTPLGPLAATHEAGEARGGHTHADMQAGMPGFEHVAGSAFPLAARSLPWERLARGALGCRFDLCQFEFAASARGGASAAPGWRPWRFAIGFAAAGLVLALVTVNFDAYRMRARETALSTQMGEILRAALPGTTAVLDPPAQLHAGVERLRAQAGEPRADDFTVLAAALARALAPVPADAIATLDYHEGTLAMSLRPGTQVDTGGLRRRLQAQGLSVQEDNAKWTLASTRQAKP